MTQQRANWSQDILVAAIQQLRHQYFRQTEACVALLIARYCNLLVDASTCSEEKKRWQDQARHWLNCYQSNRHASSSF